MYFRIIDQIKDDDKMLKKINTYSQFHVCGINLLIYNIKICCTTFTNISDSNLARAF